MHQVLGDVCSGGEGVEVLGHGTMPCLSLGHDCIEGQGFMLRGWIQPRWHASWKQQLASIITLITVIAISLRKKIGCIFQCVHLSVATSLFSAGQQQYGLCGYGGLHEEGVVPFSPPLIPTLGDQGQSPKEVSSHASYALSASSMAGPFSH